MPLASTTGAVMPDIFGVGPRDEFATGTRGESLPASWFHWAREGANCLDVLSNWLATYLMNGEGTWVEGGCNTVQYILILRVPAPIAGERVSLRG